MRIRPPELKVRGGDPAQLHASFFCPKNRSLPSQMKADDQQLSCNLFRQSPSPHVFVDWIGKSGPEGGKIGVANWFL